MTFQADKGCDGCLLIIDVDEGRSGDGNYRYRCL